MRTVPATTRRLNVSTSRRKNGARNKTKMGAVPYRGVTTLTVPRPSARTFMKTPAFSVRPAATKWARLRPRDTMTSARPEASRNTVNATSAVVTLIAEPTIGSVSLRPSLRRTATTPKHTADSRGSTSWPGRNPSRMPPAESKVVAATISAWPTTIGTVTRSPSSTMARVEETKGLRLISASAIEAPTLSSETDLSSRPPTVPVWQAHTEQRAAPAEGIITPFMFRYALHDAVVKPMPGGWNTPSLAESWSQSKDGLTYEFVLRKGVKFHNGDPVTAEDVKFSYDRYRGAGVKLLKDRVREVQIVDPGRIRFVLKEPWPDFMTFYGTSATGSGWVVPKKYVEKVGDDGFKKAPIGAGPYKFVSFNPGIELVLEAYEGYWRKTT